MLVGHATSCIINDLHHLCFHTFTIMTSTYLINYLSARITSADHSMDAFLQMLLQFCHFACQTRPSVE